MQFTIKTTIKATAEAIYSTWLSSEGHSAMTGGEAEISAKIGEAFTAWEGYIEGKNLELTPNKRILQSWRTSEFAPDEQDSLLEILFEESNGITKLTMIHSQLPAHGEQYKKGWEDHYFQPMSTYFASL